jgi:hypothetical protein
VIERIFGVLKRRFRILLLAPEFNPHLQAQIPAAACVIHNFIRVHDPADQLEAEDELDDTNHNGNDDDAFNSEANVEGLVTEEVNDHHARRDRIAEAMWNDYQRVLHDRNNENDDDSDDDDNGDYDLW